MSMVVKNNMGAVRTLNILNKNSNALSKSLAKLSSGMKINSAQDDASGYAISERMRVQIRSLEQDIQNTQNALSLMKTAEGAVSSTVEILKALKEKAINAANDSNTDSDRQIIQKEMDQFIDQIDDNALVTFNGKYLVDGSKNFRSENGTRAAFTNMALHTSTTAASTLSSLKARNGDNLGIVGTDVVYVSFVVDGQTYRFGNVIDDKDVEGNPINKLSVGNFIRLDSLFDSVNDWAMDFHGLKKVLGSANFTKYTPRNESAKGIEPEENNTNSGHIVVHAGAMIGKNAAGDAVRTADGTTGITVTANSVGYGVGKSNSLRFHHIGS